MLCFKCKFFITLTTGSVLFIVFFLCMCCATSSLTILNIYVKYIVQTDIKHIKNLYCKIVINIYVPITNFIAILLYLEFKVELFHICVFWIYICTVNIVFLKCIICSLNKRDEYDLPVPHHLCSQ